MMFGCWTPLPHTIRPEPAMNAALAQLATNQDRPGEPDKSYEFAVRLIQTAEEAGFETTLIAERFLGPDLEAWTLASALAAVTKKIELIVAVHPGLFTPQVTAKMAASLDRISAGRCALNVVNGWWEQEFDLFSNGLWIGTSEERYRRMEEFVAVMRGLWTDSNLAYAGEFYRADTDKALTGEVTKVVKPPRGEVMLKTRHKPSPPIYAASRSPIGKDVVARCCDVWFVEYAPGYVNYEGNVAKIEQDIKEMKEAAARYGRNIRFAMNPQVIIAKSPEDGLTQAAATEDPGQKERVANALGGGLVGTPEVIAERIARYEALGVDCMMMRFTPMLEGVETFAEKVMPLLRGMRQATPPPLKSAVSA